MSVVVALFVVVLAFVGVMMTEKKYEYVVICFCHLLQFNIAHVA